jgi:hypothetical protein
MIHTSWTAQDFIFFVWGQKVTMLHYNRLERFVKDKHSSLLGPFVSYEDATFDLKLFLQGILTEGKGSVQ